jgi:hypothetical protein
MSKITKTLKEIRQHQENAKRCQTTMRIHQKMSCKIVIFLGNMVMLKGHHLSGAHVEGTLSNVEETLKDVEGI